MNREAGGEMVLFRELKKQPAAEAYPAGLSLSIMS
jgi:hypothetical protein